MNATRGSISLATSQPQAGVAAPARRRLIDAPTRALHWWLALSVGLAWITGDSERWRLLHVCMGYTASGLLVAQLLWGIWSLGLGRRPLRLRATWGKLQALPAWLRHWRAGRPDLTQAQHLLLAATVLLMPTMLALSLLTGLPAWLEWPSEAITDLMADLHSLFSDLVLVALAAHIGVLIGISLLRERNLLAPMMHGYTPGRGPDLVRDNRLGLAMLISLAVLIFWAVRYWLA